MSGTRPFVRQLGNQPGVQLNQLQDNTDGAAPDASDQVFAVAARLTRGRIDRPFSVDRSNFLASTGPAESMRLSALNEAKLQADEALKNGALSGVIMRMTKATEAIVSYAIIDLSSATTAFSVAAAVPTSGTWSLAVLDHECLNDGIKLSVHADTYAPGGVAAVNPLITLRVYASDDSLRYEFAGSLSPTALDDYGQSLYLPDVIHALTDNIEVTVATAAAGILTTSDAYGRGADNKDKWVTSGVLSCFVEGTHTYTTADYDRFIDGLRTTQESFGYIISGGTQAAVFLGKLADFAREINTPAKFDISGSLTPAAAIAFAATLSLDNHYVSLYWAPLETNDPMNGGKAVFGTAGLNAGYSCYRNSQINGKGFAPKNRPIAGKPYPVNRTGIRQTYRPTDNELSDLAKAKINPVIFKNFNGGGKYVFSDCLTAALTNVSYKKLTTVAEMSATLDGTVSMYADELLMLPMQEYIKNMNAFLDGLLNGAETSGWLKKSKNLEGGVAFQYQVTPSDIRPADMVLINYWTSFDGVARQVILQQTLSR